MTAPKYQAGRPRRPAARQQQSQRAIRVYTITRVMPASPEGIEYRAKNAMDTHERVVPEAQLRPASSLA